MSKKIFMFLILGMLPIVCFSQNISSLNSYSKDDIKEIAKIGIDENMGEVLVGPAFLALSNSGAIFVADLKEGCIKQYGKDGHFVRRLGRKGKGPGEFTAPANVVVHDETVYVSDIFNKNVTVYDTTGRFMGVKNLGHNIYKIRISPFNEIVAELRDPGYISPSGKTKSFLYKYSSDFSEKTLLDSSSFRTDKFISEPFRTNLPLPFYNDYVWDMLENGNVITADAAGVEIKIINTAGKIIKKFSHNIEKSPVREEDKQSYYKSLAFSANGSSAGEVPKEIIRQLDFPDHKPFVKTIFKYGNGFVVESNLQKSDNILCNLFDNSGKYIKTVYLPQLYFNQYNAYTNSSLYKCVSSKDALPYVGVYRIPEK